jgi:hypothetical protein
MLYFHCLIIPRSAYSVSEDFEKDKVTDDKARANELAKELDRICIALDKHPKS